MSLRLCRAALFLVVAATLPAQWIHYPTPGIPRTPAGEPNLNAPVPRTPQGKPDLSGLWNLTAGPGRAANITSDLKPDEIQPWAEALYRERLGGLGKDDPWTVQCLPAGPRILLTGGNPARILQTPQIVAILYEDLSYRQIFLDGRPLPADPTPSWMGYSIGHWENDTLVIESAGFNDRSWLDMGGHPHTEALRTTERLRRTSFGHMDASITFDDPKAYRRPWTISFGVNLVTDDDMLESVCAENEKDKAHLVGRTAEEKSVIVPRETLLTYVGIYDTVSMTGTAIMARAFEVTLEGPQLMIEIGGAGKIPLVPLNQTSFSPRYLGTYEFFKDDKGVVTHLMAYSTEGDLKAVRRPAKK